VTGVGVVALLAVRAGSRGGFTAGAGRCPAGRPSGRAGL